MVSVTVPNDGRTAVQVEFEPQLTLVSTIRQFLAELVERAVGPEAAARIEIAAQELVENAVKACSTGSVAVELELARGTRGIRAQLETANTSTQWNFLCAQRAIDDAALAPNPGDYYQALMKRAAGRSDGSGLGIGRIIAEAEMKVSCERAGERVTVRATALFDKER